MNHERINFEHPAVQQIIDLIAEEILLVIRNDTIRQGYRWNLTVLENVKTIDDVKQLNWINFSPAFTEGEINENRSLQSSLKTDPHLIQHYIWYHNCEWVALLMFVHYESLGVQNLVICKTLYHTFVIELYNDGNSSNNSICSLEHSVKPIQHDWIRQYVGFPSSSESSLIDISGILSRRYTSVSEFLFDFYIHEDESEQLDWEKKFMSSISNIESLIK